MSRITKEEIEKTKCGRFLLSDENIYLSIYSLNSYVFEYNLLNTEDRILYHRLQDKFDARLINGVITRVHINILVMSGRMDQSICIFIHCIIRNMQLY